MQLIGIPHLGREHRRPFASSVQAAGRCDQSKYANGPQLDVAAYAAHTLLVRTKGRALSVAGMEVT